MKQDELNEIIYLHERWLEGCGDGKRADLRGADLRNLCLSHADLRGVNLRWCIGNGREIKTIQSDGAPIVYTKYEMAISDEQHAIADWWNFTDEQIKAMDEDDGDGALAFWRKWKPILQAIMGIGHG